MSIENSSSRHEQDLIQVFIFFLIVSSTFIGTVGIILSRLSPAPRISVIRSARDFNIILDDMDFDHLFCDYERKKVYQKFFVFKILFTGTKDYQNHFTLRLEYV
ncbi:hypothetical protein NE237_004370 [Protea cynaroides]|uniref:Uncharacterized protein n=1 Tax=Protea cynaroides TaxID=273540 RepID=A0A9Q0KJB5_9MAGN|nr:hypothetical protein NE237_004370 [Protea cynaroides]